MCATYLNTEMRGRSRRRRKLIQYKNCYVTSNCNREKRRRAHEYRQAEVITYRDTM